MSENELQTTDLSGSPQSPVKEAPARKIGRELLDWVETFCIALAVMVVLFLFVFKYVSVVGTSMTNTLQADDKLIISSIGNNYEQGDIIVIRTPVFTKPIVKRVIATEGQTVEIDFDNWLVTVDGVTLDEAYVRRTEGIMRFKEYYTGPITVEEGMVFVMGDNRNGSDDSRDPSVGQLPVDHILGKVILRIYPFGQFGTVD